jgi:hypothetical protein
MSEETLLGGNTGGAVRIGNVVHERAAPWTPTVHALLRHLEDAGVDGVPGVLGFDDQGRQMLTYLPGEVIGDGFPWPAWVYAGDQASIALLPIAGRLEQSESHVEALPGDFWTP